MFLDSYVALDITSSDIRVIAINNKKISKWGSTPVPEGLIKDGIIVNAGAVSVIIDTLFKSLKLPRNRVICTLTALPFLYRTINMPGTGQKVSAEAIQRAAKKEMSLMGEDMYLLWQALAEQKSQDETNYFVLGVPKNSFHPLLETLQAAKIKPYVIGIKPLAVARAASVSDACVVSLERNYFDIVLVANGIVRVIHSISPSVNPDDVAGIVSEFLDGFNKAVKSFNRDYPQDNFGNETPILLSGELAANADLPHLVQESTGHPANVITPSMDIPPELPLAQYVANIGLAFKKMHHGPGDTGYHDININLLTGLQKASTRKVPLVYAAAGVGVIILAILAFQAFNLKNDATTRVATLNKESAQVTQRINDLQKANKDALAAVQDGNTRVQNLQTELAAVGNDDDKVLNKKVDFATRITAVNTALPVNLDYESIKMDASSSSITGTAQNPDAIFTFTRNLETEDYFTVARISKISPADDQEEVTYEIVIPQ